MDDNRALVADFYDEVINGGRLELVDEIVAEDFVEHGTRPAAPGREGFKVFLRELGGGLSDIRWQTHDVIAEADRVVVRGSIEGTHTGDLFGHAPTGRRVSWTAIHIWRVTDGQLRERWAEVNLLNLMEQLRSDAG
jgi:predicted ester cyclase